MRRPGRPLVTFCIAVVLIAALVPGVAALVCALVEPAWTPGELVLLDVPPALELPAARPYRLAFSFPLFARPPSPVV